jgi:hypothetical protein
MCKLSCEIETPFAMGSSSLTTKWHENWSRAICTEERASIGTSAVASYWIVDPKNRIVLAKFGSRLTMADAEQYAADLRNNPAFDPSFSELSDLTEVVDAEIDYASAARFARESDPFSHQSKRAIIAPRPAIFALARMYRLIRNDENIVLFKTIEEAKRWLGL